MIDKSYEKHLTKKSTTVSGKFFILKYRSPIHGGGKKQGTFGLIKMKDRQTSNTFGLRESVICRFPKMLKHTLHWIA